MNGGKEVYGLTVWSGETVKGHHWKDRHSGLRIKLHPIGNKPRERRAKKGKRDTKSGSAEGEAPGRKCLRVQFHIPRQTVESARIGKRTRCLCGSGRSRGMGKGNVLVYKQSNG